MKTKTFFNYLGLLLTVWASRVRQTHLQPARVRTRAFCPMRLYLLTGIIILSLFSTQALRAQESLSIVERVTVDVSNFTNYNPGGANGATVGVITVSTTANYKNQCSTYYIHLLKNSTMTVSASSGSITKIVFSPRAYNSSTCTGANGINNNISANVGSVNGSVWSYDTGTSSVTFTADNAASFNDFTVTLTHTSSSCPFTFPSSISMTVASGSSTTQTVSISGTTGYTWYGSSLSSDALGGSSETAELTDYSASSNEISVTGAVPGTYYGTLDVEYSRYTPYSYYEISIPITVTVTGCADIRSQEVDVTASTPTYNCTTGYWESTISWDAIPGATRYNVRMMEYNGSAFAYIGDWYNAETNLTYTYTNLETGKEYRAKVMAVNQTCPTIDSSNDNHTLYGSGQGASDDFTITCPTVEVIADAAGILANSANITVLSEGDICSDMKYDVVVSTSRSYTSPVYSVSNQTAESYSVTGLSSQTKYYYKVTATNACGSYDTYEGDFTTSKALDDYRYMCIDLELRHTDYLTNTNPIMITSAAGQQVKGERTLELIINGATPGATVTLAGTGLAFYKSDGSSAASLTTNATTGNLDETIVIAYAPTAYVSESFATPDITVSCEGNNIAFPGLVTGRCLPDQFVIAAKAGNEWVALTAKITASGTQDAIPIQVDNTTTPTKASVAMNTSEYQLLGLQADAPSVAKARFKLNGTAVHFYSTQSTKVLNASTSSASGEKTKINTYATHANAATSPDSLFYEWKLVSTDLVNYYITNSNRTNTSNLELGYSASSGKWGMYYGGSSHQNVMLLPIETVLTEMEVEVMEWATDGMALRFASTAPSTVKVTLGGSTSAAKTLTRLSSSDIYTVSGLSLTGNNCEVMMLTDGSDASKGALIRKPILVNSTTAKGSDYRTALTDDVCASCDIVILNGAKLTADQAKTNHTDFANIYVYPGGKLELDAKSLGVKQQVYVRGGYSWLNTSTYALPELYINGNISFNGSGGIIYDYYIQNYKYYQFTLPYTVPLAKVTDEASVDNFPVWVKHYDGSLRAANPKATSWAWYNGDNFEAGKGYIIAARPRQVGNVANRPLSIIRFPLTNTAYNGSGETEKSVTTTAHGIAGYNAGTVSANNVGWNFVGNPFMATWKGDIGHKQLDSIIVNGKWNGRYQWNDADTKYVTVMSPTDGTDYDQYVAANTELKPFFPFFMQETSAGGTGMLTFAVSNRIKKQPSVIRSDKPREGFVQINLSADGSTDQTGLYVSDKYSDDLDTDDLEKMFGSSTAKPKVWLMHDETRMAFEAMKEQRAASSVPLGYRAPAEGDYLFSLDQATTVDLFDKVLLTDNEEGIIDFNLLVEDYEFKSKAANFNDTRFTVRVVMKDEQGEVATDLSGDTDLNNLSVVNTPNGIILQGVPQDAQVWVYDMTGKLISAAGNAGQTGNAGTSGVSGTLQFAVPTGVYNIRVQTGSEGVTLRAIVK